MNGVAFIHIQYFSYLEHVTSFFAILASCPKLENCASAQKTFLPITLAKQLFICGQAVNQTAPVLLDYKKKKRKKAWITWASSQSGLSGSSRDGDTGTAEWEEV